MTISEQMALAAIFDFGQVFVSMKLREQALVFRGTPYCFWFSSLDNISSEKNHVKKQQTDSLMNKSLMIPHSIQK